jgi:hypothetical protein
MNQNYHEESLKNMSLVVIMENVKRRRGRGEGEKGGRGEGERGRKGERERGRKENGRGGER